MINAVVKGQGLKINHPKVVADTIAYLEMSVEFKTTDWDDLVKYVHFTLGDDRYTFELVDDKITQDMHLDLTEGEWEVSIHGAEYLDGELKQRITTEPVVLYVNRTGDLNGEPFPELTGSVGEQVVAKAELALQIALELKKSKVARIGEVTLLASKWVGSDTLYSQVVDIEGVTEHSQVDLTPDVQQLSVFYNKDITFVTENDDGVVTVYVIGQKPENDYTIQVTITEVNV